MSTLLSGLVAAPFTPFRATGDLAPETIPTLARLLHRNRVAAAFVCGTTGEGSSLTSEERKLVASTWRDSLPDGLKLVVHVGHLSASESRMLARHAQDIGADAIAAIAPSFFKPASAAELVAWCADVASAAPQLPFYYYHMPAMTGVPILATDFLTAAHNRIPTLVGVKFTDENLEDYAAARAVESGRYNILFGRDEILLSGLRLGAPGAVGSTYNYSAPLYHALIDAFWARDLDTAGRLQARAQAFIDVFSRLGGLPAAKVIMKFIGVDCGPVRLPLRTIPAEEEAVLRTGLEACGFFEYASRL